MARMEEVPGMPKRLAPTAQWLASGYRYDDAALW
jgi:hypothetical protein